MGVKTNKTASIMPFTWDVSFRYLSSISTDELLARYESKRETTENCEKISCCLILRRSHPTKNMGDIKFEKGK